MSNYHCYLCASDDGIQLDIFGVGGKAICEKIESCLSVKIEENNAIATKICHKCAFELDACSKFVAKYRQSRDSTKRKSNPIKGHCSLCSEPGKIGYIFDCKEGNPANDTLHKIQEIFDDSIFTDKRRTLSICLDCRYNLDVLFDLKCIYQSTPDKLRHLNEKGLQLSELPKTKTRVVKRKTTFIPVARLNGTEAYDTDSSSVTSIMSYKRKRGRPHKDTTAPTPSVIYRTCEQCEINVESGIDMYRYHRTGITVCKECWLAMDPEKVTHNKRKKLGISGGEVGTRRCAIILKDVLTNPAKYDNIYKVEKDEHGNTTFIVTDDSSENEEREKTPAKRSRRSHGSVASVDETPAKRTRAPKRSASTKSTDLEDEPPAKIRDKAKPTQDNAPPVKVKDKLKKVHEDRALTLTNVKTKNGLATSDTEVFESRTRRRFGRKSTDSEKNAKAASDAELTKPLAKKRGPRTKLDKSQTADLSLNETKTAVTSKGRKTGKNAAPVVSTVRRTRAHSLSSQDATSLSNRHSNVSTIDAKSVSETESPPTKTRRSKTKSLSPKNSATELEVENPYTCSVCHVEYRNKLIGMKHELTHAKQPEVKLQRVTIPEIIVEEAPAESSLIEEPEEQSHDVNTTPVNRPGYPENVETSVPVALHEEPSKDVRAETNENENLEKSKSSPELAEITAKVDNTQETEQNKIADKTLDNKGKIEDKTLDNKDKNEDKADENENKDRDIVDKTNNITEDKTEDTEDKSEEKTEDTEDKSEEKTEDTEDKSEEKTKDTEDKNEEKTEDTKDKSEEITEDTKDKNVVEMEDKNEDKTEEPEDKKQDTTDERAEETENKADETEEKMENKTNETEAKIEDETEACESTEAKITVGNKNVEENNIENTRQAEANDTLKIAEAEENNDDEETAITDVKAAHSEKPEAALSEAVDKEVDSSEAPEKLSEQVLTEAALTSENLNGVDVQDDANCEINNANGVERNAAALNCDGESKALDDLSREKSIESDNIPPVTSTSPEKNDDIQDIVKDIVSLDDNDDDTSKDVEAEAKADTTEGSIFPENNATKDSEGSESIVSDVLTEVFDLATAEVQKRLDNEPSRDEKSTTPVSETLENISREISNSADMPSLEPIVENQSSNIQS